jgi:hypothetical protein
MTSLPFAISDIYDARMCEKHVALNVAWLFVGLSHNVSLKEVCQMLLSGMTAFSNRNNCDTCQAAIFLAFKSTHVCV